MSQYLEAHIDNSYLPPFGNFEGQMAPRVKRLMMPNRWRKGSRFDWKDIRKEWEILALKEGKSVFIEASPPNIMRVTEILEEFKDSKHVFSLASPYSYVGSCVYNYAKKSYSSSHIKKRVNEWISRAKKQMENISGIPGAKLITYEKFCANPSCLLGALAIENKDINSSNNLSIQGKNNSGFRNIVDMLPKHIAFLGAKGILEVNESLSIAKDVLLFFGYKTLSIGECDSLISEHPLIAFDGLQRRIQLRLKLESQGLPLGFLSV